MKKFLLPLLLVFTTVISAQDTSLYLRRQYETPDGNTLPYRILYPENYDKAKKYPLVLFLHGAGERGSDNNVQLMHGSKLFLADSNRKNFPAIVVFPQCPAESFWAVADVDRNTQPFAIKFNYNKPANWPLLAVINLVNQIKDEEAVDASRIYITGLSMGGMGTFEAVHRNPDLFAAALPICGGGDEESYTSFKGKTPFWVFHGDSDVVVNVNLSRAMVKKLEAVKIPVRYSEYKGVNHNSWDNAFKESDYLRWMFGKRK